jgi:cell fate (sporulation/competence/biofilm development) regulator YlbF (YheA/YmcA/DUF963 family)
MEFIDNKEAKSDIKYDDSAQALIKEMEQYKDKLINTNG